MTTIKATCPGCGEVSLCPWQITLTCGGLREASYSFDCPSCGGRVWKPADDRVVRLLMSGGIEPTAERRFDWPTFTFDDVLDFHLLLAMDGWEAGLMGGTL